MPNRYICDVLEEMRKCHETRNFSYLLGLIEEAQTMANRMESSLGCKREYNHWHDKLKKEQQEYNDLVQRCNKMRKELGKKEKEITPKRW